MEKAKKLFISWLYWGYYSTIKGVDVFRQPALIPYYVMLNFFATTAYIYIGSQTPVWFCFFFSSIMGLQVVFELYLFKCVTDPRSRSFIGFGFTNTLIIWAYYVMCFMHPVEWSRKHTIEIPIFQVLGGLCCYMHYIFIGSKDEVEIQDEATEC